jgi:hypothetical protein
MLAMNSDVRTARLRRRELIQVAGTLEAPAYLFFNASPELIHFRAGNREERTARIVRAVGPVPEDRSNRGADLNEITGLHQHAKVSSEARGIGEAAADAHSKDRIGAGSANCKHADVIDFGVHALESASGYGYF